MSQFLDKTGLSYLWGKIKSYVSSNFLSKSGGVVNGDINMNGTLRTQYIKTYATYMEIGDTVQVTDEGITFASLGKITRLANPINSGDAATKGYVDDLLGDSIKISEKSTTIPVSGTWYGVTYGNGKFVAVDYGSNNIIYSINGISWKTATMPFSANWQSVTFGAGKFVAVVDGSNNGAYSYDGITWTTMTMPANESWYSVRYGNGRFVAIAYFYNKAAYSTDGITWTLSNNILSSSNRFWQVMTYGDGKFVAFVYDHQIVAYSSDGLNWYQGSLQFSENWNDVVYGGGKFVAVATQTANYAYSTDGIYWYSGTMPLSANWGSVAYGNGRFVASAGNNVAVSMDGTTWQQAYFPGSGSYGHLVFGQGKFVAFNDTSSVYSYDGFTWYTTGDVLVDSDDVDVSEDISKILGDGPNPSTTLAGYGITDAYTKTEVDSKIVSAEIVIDQTDWTDNVATVAVDWVTAYNTVIVAPDPNSQESYTSSGVICVGQSSGQLTFNCTTAPEGDIQVNIVILK